MSLIGHNRGPSMAVGTGWQKHCWSKARADLMPKLPIEVIRMRLRRAQELGLDYKAYASVRATSGHDIIALLFSSNALRAARDGAVPQERADKLLSIASCEKLGVVAAPLAPETMAARLSDVGVKFDHVIAAPTLMDSHAATRDRLLSATKARKLPKDRVLVIGDTTLEAQWSSIAQMAGYISANQYFSAPTP